MINIVVTSKPVDGLFYYSYEYCSLLNDAGIDAQIIVIPHRKFIGRDYLDVIKNKYIHCKNIQLDTYLPYDDDVTLILGRSMMTLSWQDFDNYDLERQMSLSRLFDGKIISVYSENHPTEYPLAIDFFNPAQVIDLCDTEVYPNGTGDYFEKRINFKIYKSYKDNKQFEYLFFGTNNKYYAAAEKILHKYPDYGILTYNADYVNIKNNNFFVPVADMLGMFDTYVYTKETFDPAPRIIQECKYYGKNMIYERDKTIVDGGSIYWGRSIQEPDITPIVSAAQSFECK